MTSHKNSRHDLAPEGPAKASRALVIGPAFFGYNQSIARALVPHGFDVEVIDAPNNSPAGLVNRLRIDLAVALGIQRFKVAWKERFNRHILDTAARVAPDLLLVIRGEWMTPDTFSAIPAGRKIIWFQDTARRSGADHVELARRADAVFVFETSDIDYLAERGVPRDRIAFLPMGHDPVVYSDLELPETVDVCFVGRMYEERKALIHRLVDELPELRFEVWGRYLRYREPRTWMLWLRRQMDRRSRQTYRNRNIAPQDTSRVYNRSRISLNIHHNQSQGGCNPRVFEICSTGAFQLCDRNRYVETEVSPELVQFEGYDDLKAKILAFVADDAARRAIAATCKAAVQRHTFEARMATALSVLRSLPGRADG